MRQLGLAMLNYVNAHEGRFPRTDHDGTKQSWVLTLSDFLEDVDQVRVCPDDPKADARLEAEGTSYLLNQYLVMSIPGSANRIAKLQATSRTIAALEGANARRADAVTDHAHTADWFSAGNVRNGFVWIRIANELQPDRHGGGANYLFVDGHVQYVQSAQIQEWATEGVQFIAPDRFPRE